MKIEPRTPVVITTTNRGVFFGYYESNDENVFTILDARNCFYWSAECKGFVGLAGFGPMPGSKVGPKTHSMTLYNVSAVLLASKEAVKRWESAEW